MGGWNGARYVGACTSLATQLIAVSILSSTLTPGVHPTFPLRFVSYGTVFPMPETAAPNADVVVDLISSYVGSRKPGELMTARRMGHTLGEDRGDRLPQAWK